MKWNHRRVFLKVSLKELSGCWRTFLAAPSVSKEKWRLTWFCQGLFTSNKHGEYEDIWLIKLKCVPHLMTPSGPLSCKLANLWFFFSLCSMLNHCTLNARHFPVTVDWSNSEWNTESDPDQSRRDQWVERASFQARFEPNLLLMSHVM